MPLRVVPLTLAQANDLVARWHRHHVPVIGHRFSIGAEVDGRLCGAAIVGRPVARKTDPARVAEVTRLVTDGTPNACSLLYGAAARAARAMGFARIQTFIRQDECGTSLRAAGWCDDGLTERGDFTNATRPGQLWLDGQLRRSDPAGPKRRWIREWPA